MTLGVDLNDHIHIALTDHLSFALERLKSGYEIKNKLLHEIKMLYKEEYRIAEWAKRKVLTNLNIEIPDDEVGFIALHIHTAKMNHQSMQPVLDATTFVNDVIEMIEKQFSIQIREDSISYQRLLTHLKFAFQRIQNNDSFHEIDKDMLAIIKEKHKEAFACAQNISKLIKSDYGYDLPTSEQAYITLHIQRLLNK